MKGCQKICGNLRKPAKSDRSKALTGYGKFQKQNILFKEGYFTPSHEIHVKHGIADFLRPMM